MFLSEWREFPSAPCLAGRELGDSSCLDVVEIARVPDMLPSLLPSWSGQGLISTPVHAFAITWLIFKCFRIIIDKQLFGSVPVQFNSSVL